MPSIPNVNNCYSLLTQTVTTTSDADKKADINLIKQLFSINTSADKTIAISNKDGNMEINILYPKKKFGIPLLFSIVKQKKITIPAERFKGIMLTPSKDPKNKMGVNVKLITDLPSD